MVALCNGCNGSAAAHRIADAAVRRAGCGCHSPYDAPHGSGTGFMFGMLSIILTQVRTSRYFERIEGWSTTGGGGAVLSLGRMLVGSAMSATGRKRHDRIHRRLQPPPDGNFGIQLLRRLALPPVVSRTDTVSRFDRIKVAGEGAWLRSWEAYFHPAGTA